VESLGEKLRTTRESKGISFEQAGLDTNLSIRYLESLESENFSRLPGETYIKGSIRNYGVYLDLDVDELLAMYRAIKIQEQPIPVEQLLKKPSVLPKIAIGVVVALLVFGAAAGVFLFMVSRPVDAGVVFQPARIPIEYIMSGDVFEHGAASKEAFRAAEDRNRRGGGPFGFWCGGGRVPVYGQPPRGCRRCFSTPQNPNRIYHERRRLRASFL